MCSSDLWAAFLAARDPSALKLAELLLAKGADPNAETNGTTALHIAVNNIAENAKDASLIENLLRAGANPAGVAAKDPAKLNATPIMLAAWNGKTAAALALARGGGDIESAIRTARNHQHPELAAALETLARTKKKPKAEVKKKRR